MNWDVNAPYGYDVSTHTEVTPRSAPVTYTWYIKIGPKQDFQPPENPVKRPFSKSEVTVQLTADQQVELSISGEDKYGNPVDISGDVVWVSSDESIIAVTNSAPDKATASAVGPAGTASVTVTNDVDRDGTGDFMGSIAIDVVAGAIAEIAISAGEPTQKP